MTLNVTPESNATSKSLQQGGDQNAREVDLVERDIFEFGGANCERVVARVAAQLDASDY